MEPTQKTPAVRPTKTITVSSTFQGIDNLFTSTTIYSDNVNLPIIFESEYQDIFINTFSSKYTTNDDNLSELEVDISTERDSSANPKKSQTNIQYIVNHTNTAYSIIHQNVSSY